MQVMTAKFALPNALLGQINLSGFDAGTSAPLAAETVNALSLPCSDLSITT